MFFGDSYCCAMMFLYELKDTQAPAADDKLWGDPVTERIN